MRFPSKLYDLPASILLLISFAPLDVYSENLRPRSSHGALHERHEQILARMAWEPPSGVRKMPADPAAMFYLDYWQFKENMPAEEEEETSGDDSTSENVRRGLMEDITGDEYDGLGNISTTYKAKPPFALHDQRMSFKQWSLRMAVRNVLSQRDFRCPSGTQSCTNIDRPNSCCDESDTCVLISDTGIGDVGCCPEGEDCGGSISQCDESAGYTSCPNSSNGGCCIPDYMCEDVGCVFQNTQTVTQTGTPVPAPAPSSSRATSPSSSTTPTTSAQPTTTRTSSPSPSDTERSSATAAPPVRPTPDDTTSLTTTTSTLFGSACPTGFYMCSAYYQGGCCQVDRDCHSTSCPPQATDTVINTDGVTVAAPSGATGAAPSYTCATGWFSCAASLGGDCCPSGYACATDSCSATASGGNEVSKQDPGSTAAHPVVFVWLASLLATGSGLAMVLL